MLSTVAERFARVAPAGVDFCSLRVVDERSEELSLRGGVLQPVRDARDVGAMVTVHADGGLGYAATPDLSEAGLARAVQEATDRARRTAPRAVFDTRTLAFGAPSGEYRSPVARPWSTLSLADKLDLLRTVDGTIGTDARIVDREVSLTHLHTETLFMTADGGQVRQEVSAVTPDITVVAHQNGRTQRRSMGTRVHSQQGGLEVLERVGFDTLGHTLAQEALELLAAPDCPTGQHDLLLDPGQMTLQVHESIGHPVELDRILGDERNYAGTSFVTLDMFGSYQYGSSLLNVSFDPTVPGEYASYGFDDDGTRAERQWIIRGGLLVRPLGGSLSQARAGGVPGVANSRACSWNRPPIDRMANLNVEPGDSSFEELVSRVERGVYMRSNTSWSIDDRRDKFQFGCEWGQLIEDGELTTVVRNPNYRGRSATFWRNLAGVGDRSTWKVLGTPYCGKGEPNQVVRVGHATPTCLFRDVAVFGGA